MPVVLNQQTRIFSQPTHRGCGMSRSWRVLRVAGLLIVAAHWLIAGAAADDAPVFSTQIRPLLSRYCFACHGPDPAARQADLRLDTAVGLFGVSSEGAMVVVPGDADASLLFRRISAPDAELRMPPAATQHQLNSAQIELFRQWISAGGRFDEHWSFVAPRPIDPPQVGDSWGRNAIDQFVLQRLQQEGLRPAAEADRMTLIRRLSLDLTGLPPTPELILEFAGENSEESYQQLVDRLLRSEHYGEQWARHWLDLAHYADSDGYLGDAMRPYAWLYRDWVISSINADQSFDQFTVEQLAGDLLPDATLQQKIATGFLRNTLTNTEAGVDLEEYRLKEITDRVSTLGTGWLGLSLGCAECHSHKYDPISQQEFYELFSFFNDADDVDTPAASDAEQERWQRAEAAWEQRLRELQQSVTAAWRRAPETPGGVDDTELKVVFTALQTEEKKRSSEQKAAIAAVRTRIPGAQANQLAELEQHSLKRPAAPATKARTVAARTTGRETWVHVRGNYRQRGVTVRQGTPAFLPALRSRGVDADRLDLARWLVSAENPLTARVVVNRWWSHLFGKGLVSTIDNFGSGGAAPSHPQLLDWLALELQRQQWSRRELLRMIVTSATYRQSSAMRPELEERDPQNELLARQGRFRLSAEQIRDAALTASGLLHRSIGGPSIRPPQPDYVAAISRNVTWEVTKGPDLYRRGLYVLLRRATPYPMLQAFDAPDSTVACVQRERTNSPLQALTLLNDPVFVECAEHLGRELQQMSSLSPGERIGLAIQRCLGRDGSAVELDRLELFLRSQQDDEERSTALEQAAWTAVARVLLNLDEFMTRE